MAAATTNSRRLTGPASRGAELLLLFSFAQCGRELLEFSLEQLREVPGGVTDPVIGNAGLREVVGADLLRALTAADLHEPRFPLLTRSLLAFAFQQPSPQHRQCLLLVLQLRLAVLAGDDDLVLRAGLIRDPHGGIGCVDRLATRPRGAEHVHPVI